MTDMNGRNFYYNKENYILKLKPEIEKYFKAKQLLIFGIIVPFFIPLKNQNHLTYHVNKNELCHYRFHTIENKVNVYTGAYNEEPLNLPKKCTRVEMVYISKDKPSLDKLEEFLSEKFDLLVGGLNQLVSSIIVLTKDPYVSKITREVLDPTILYSIIDPKNYTLKSEGLFQLNFNKLEQGGGYLTDINTKRVMEGIDLLPNNPFFRAAELFYGSKRSLSNGDYTRAVIDSQTSVEIFLTALYKYLLKKEGFSKSEIDKKSNEMRFKSMVIDHFHKRLGGDFNVDDIDSPVGNWWENTYLLRNNVVHEGYLPDFEKTEKCLDAVNTLNNYLTDLFHSEKIKKKYPELSQLVLKPTN
ncbi:hypothetical protein AS034_05360 [[Bacillus] enclensis]|uniref:Apea-like HEPN domain-containing protein n=1 Tax=[Bacillus] enclensis TaxID=1402860 RepID=A0A0V8HM86_9BACI|nr:hypothetical protein [[Bacillus] enclensis]KSU63676.1 hypothetical protein AS034_05360 [[Bacillus] enclensis]SCB87908.1 hypothetical protein GA0061094_1117 [[Bacillus] enclensis]